MYSIRRWWERHGVPMILVGLALTGAWTVRQTQGVALYELYQWLTRPFQAGPPRAEQLATARYLELQERLIELESQNQQLQQLIGYAATVPKSGMPANVIGRGADHWWQQITLGKGSRQGIQPGFIVTGPGGLVGRVTNVTPNSSRVLLISDPTSQVGVVISRSRHTGFIRGQSGNRVILEFFDKDPDVRRGDVISTSSFSQLFPPGLPIGRVESVNLTKSPAPEATIELSAPFSQLEWVVVTPFRPNSSNGNSPEPAPASSGPTP